MEKLRKMSDNLSIALDEHGNTLMSLCDKFIAAEHALKKAEAQGYISELPLLEKEYHELGEAMDCRDDQYALLLEQNLNIMDAMGEFQDDTSGYDRNRLIEFIWKLKHDAMQRRQRRGIKRTALKDYAYDMALSSNLTQEVNKAWLGVHRGMEKQEKRSKSLRKDTIKYYEASRESVNIDGEPITEVWCHLLGKWQYEKKIKVAHIVPACVSRREFDEFYFGGDLERLHGAENVLMMTHTLKSLYDQYFFMILPANPTDTKDDNWKIVVLPDKHLMRYDERLPVVEVGEKLRGKYVAENRTRSPGCPLSDLDGRILQFRGQNRPSRRYLYYRCLLTMIRIKDFKRKGWDEQWRRYGNQPPFPTPKLYLRSGALIALALTYGLTDKCVIRNFLLSHELVDKATIDKELAAPAFSFHASETLARLYQRANDQKHHAIMNSTDLVSRVLDAGDVGYDANDDADAENPVPNPRLNDHCRRFEEWISQVDPDTGDLPPFPKSLTRPLSTADQEWAADVLAAAFPKRVSADKVPDTQELAIKVDILTKEVESLRKENALLMKGVKER